MEARRSAVLVNDAGLHARPCHAVVRVALAYESDLRIACGGRAVNGKSILELMTLAAARGDELDLRAEGPDAEALLEAVASLVEEGFSE